VLQRSVGRVGVTSSILIDTPAPGCDRDRAPGTRNWSLGRWAAIELDACHASRCDRLLRGEDLRRSVTIYGRRGSLVCVEKFGPDHGWRIVELIV
jgi:hypothetical protein